MELLKKDAQYKIEKNIDGFINDELKKAKHPINLRELYLLRILIGIITNYDNLESFETRGKQFFWISYSLIIKRLEGIHYTKKMMRMDIESLEASGFIDRYIDRNGGSSKVFFHITKITKSIFIFDLP